MCVRGDNGSRGRVCVCLRERERQRKRERRQTLSILVVTRDTHHIICRQHTKTHIHTHITSHTHTHTHITHTTHTPNDALSADVNGNGVVAKLTVTSVRKPKLSVSSTLSICFLKGKNMTCRTSAPMLHAERKENLRGLYSENCKDRMISKERRPNTTNSHQKLCLSVCVYLYVRVFCVYVCCFFGFFFN